MIFPDIPRRIEFAQASTPSSQSSVDTPKTPLRDLAETVEITSVSAEKWLGSAKDPAALKPIDWMARDAWEFYLVCTGMIIWCAYWLGVHRGAW